ncbi:MAG: M16 family metallopeptidase, partial [Caulobacteraceae bacterium]
VYRDQIAAQIFADAELRNQGGLFYAGAILASGKSVDAGVAALQGEVARLRAAPVSPAELAIAKNQLLAQAVHDRETVDGRAMALGDAVVEEGSAERANSDIAEIAAVTPADVLRVARKYLAPDREVVIRYTEGPAAPEGPPAVPGATAAPLSPFIGAPAVLRPASERTPPPPVGAPVKANLPVPAERTLPNGLEVIVARSSDLPLIAADLLVRSGSVDDPRGRAGAAALTADLVTEGTTTRTAPEIARQIEALGAELRTGSASESSSVSTSVLSANAAPALAIMADVVENPIFAPKELERARSQRLDALAVAYQRPGSIASMLADPVVFAGTPLGHSADGDPASLKSIDRSDVVALHHLYWRPDNAVLVITGDVTPQEGFGLARDAFGSWMRPDASLPTTPPIEARGAPRDLAVDLPGTGQAAVVLVGPAIPRSDTRYIKALVAN